MVSPICATNMKRGMSERQKVLSYWLMPSTPDALRFQAVIDAMADQQSAPRFRAHLSFGSVSGEEPPMEAILSKLQGLTLHPVEIARTPSFTMSLFVRFAPNQGLVEARTLLASSPGFQSSRAFDPHISLCYGAPANADSLEPEIAALMEKPVQFDQLIAMMVSLPVETHEDVAAWTQHASYRIPLAD